MTATPLRVCSKTIILGPPSHTYCATFKITMIRSYSVQPRGLSWIESIHIAVTSAFTALKDPSRQDMVAALGESTGPLFLSRMRDRMLLDPTGRKILQTQPVIHSSTLPPSLSVLPQNTFGYQYYIFLTSHNVSPDTRTPVKYISNPELGYVMSRYRQVHDFCHTLLGLGISVEEELALKWFEMMQTGLPVSILSSFVGPIRLTTDERQRFFSVYVPWAIQCGSRSKFLMNIMYENLFERDLEEIRKEIGIWTL